MSTELPSAISESASAVELLAPVDAESPHQVAIDRWYSSDGNVYADFDDRDVRITLDGGGEICIPRDDFAAIARWYLTPQAKAHSSNAPLGKLA